MLGGFDKTREINEICKKYDIWHHVDSCWGGFLAWASPEKRQELFDGIELVDSLSFNPHKGWSVPTQCCSLLVNDHKGLLRDAFQSGASYLFFENELSAYDIGDRTISCGRRPDGVKLYMFLKKHGLEGVRKIADQALDNAKYFENQVKARPNF